MQRRGFTLLELMVVIGILLMLVSIVYASFASVVNSTQATRAAAEELRLREFLARSLKANFSTVYVSGSQDGGFLFEGIDDESADGPKDSVRFFAMAPLIGGLALPGDVKEVRYEAIDQSSNDEDLAYNTETDAGERPPVTLEAMETPYLAGGGFDAFQEKDMSEEPDADLSYEAPCWSVPMRTFDVEYYDGEEWVQEWNSLEMGRVPWSVHIRINFAKPEQALEADRESGFDVEEDPDFEMVIPIPVGMGVWQDEVAGGQARDSNSGNAAEDKGSNRNRSSRQNSSPARNGNPSP